VSDVPDFLTAQLTEVRTTVVRLMQVLVRDGTTYEKSAGEIAGLADIFDQNGSFGEAEAMRVVARNYRIRILEVQGRIAALRHQYADLYEDLS
jgi:hypothetical protein